MSEKYKQLQQIADQFNAQYFPASKFCAFVSPHSVNGKVMRMIQAAMENGGLNLLADGSVLQQMFPDDVRDGELELRVANGVYAPSISTSLLKQFVMDKGLDFKLPDLQALANLRDNNRDSV